MYLKNATHLCSILVIVNNKFCNVFYTPTQNISYLNFHPISIPFYVMNSSFKFYKSKQKILDLGPVIDCSDKDEDKVSARIWWHMQKH